MELNEYQTEAAKTVLPSIKGDVTYFTLGLCGESGEVAELLKKSIRDQRVFDKDNVKAELGDCLWYISQLSACFGLTLEEIAEANIKKLTSRQRRGKLNGSGDNR